MRRMLAVLLTIVFTAAPVHGAEKGKHHESHSQAQGEAPTLKLDQGRKWKTDAPLRQGMEEIKKLLQADLAKIHNRKADQEAYQRIAAGMDERIQSIFKNCKLPPEADSQLHLVLVELIKGSERMKAGTGLDERRSGAVQALQGLELYGKYFDHPGWKSPAH